MRLKELLEYYGSHANIMRETKVGSTSIINWKKQGYIPIVSQQKIERNTKKMFIARLEDEMPRIE